MNLEKVDVIVRWTGGLFSILTLGIVLYGIWRGTQRQAGRILGFNVGWLRSTWFYLFSTAVFLGLSYLGWIPLPWVVSPIIRSLMLSIGALLYFPGLSLVLWGRLALGKNYFVSTALGAQLFAGHQLVTKGPFSIMRHPMYTGLILAALGSLLIYSTWTTLVFSCFAPLITIRAWREELALAEEFGKEWQEYKKHVHAFFPRRR